MRTLTLTVLLLVVCAGVAYAAVTRNGVAFTRSTVITDCSVNYDSGPPPQYIVTEEGPPEVNWRIDDPADIKPVKRREAIKKGLDAAMNQNDANNQVTINNGDCSRATTAPPPR